MSVTQIRTSLAAVVVIAAALSISACGSSNSSTSTSTAASTDITATKDATIAATVPTKYSSAGTISVATDATYPPMEFVKEGNNDIIGADADLAAALGQVMGIKMKLQNVPFDSILAGLGAGKYGLGMSSFTDNKEREATVDFVTYLAIGTSFFEKSGSSTNVNTIADLCGLSVAVEKGTVQQKAATTQSAACVADGKKKANVLIFPDQNGANNALISGRADVGMADTVVAAYLSKETNGQLKTVGQAFGKEPYGIAMAKDSGLSAPILAALKNLIAGGQYAAILKKWDLTQGAITDPTVNGAIS